MLGERNVHRRNFIGKPVFDHAPRAVTDLLGRLEQRNRSAVPMLPRSGEQSGRAKQTRHVHVMAAACMTGTSLPGTVTAVGGGTIRDMMVGQIPTVLRSELYAIPALAAAVITVAAVDSDVYGLPAALIAAAVCFAIRMVVCASDSTCPARQERNRTPIAKIRTAYTS
jgi:hypothetical protein